MAHITYRQGVDTGVNSSTTTKNSGLSNIEIDKNFRTLDTDKLDKSTTTAQTVASAVTFSNNIVISGNLEVNGTTTTINSTTLAIDDKNIVLGDVATPTNVTADGGGITLKGATDKTLNWVNADSAWTSSEHVKLAAGKNVVLSGATSGTVTLATAAVAAATTITFPATTGTVVTTGDTGTVTNTMLAGSIANGKLVNSAVTVGTTAINLGAASTTLAGLTSVTSTSFVGDVTGTVSGNAGTATKLATARAINGVNFDGSAGITITANTTNALTAGSYLTGGTFNGSAAVTIAVDATNANTASKVVARDASGNFSAGTITASLTGNVTGNVTGNLTGDVTGTVSGNAGTATKLATPRAINGVNFDGSAGITITANTPNALVLKFDTGSAEGTDLYTFNGNAAKTVDIKAGTNVTITKAAGVITIASSNPGGTVTSVTGTAPIAVSNGTTTPAISISAATQAAAGSMSATDKAKLDGIAANANNYSLPLAADGTRGGVQIGFATDAPNRNYAVQLSSEKMYVNVPWSDNNTITTVGVGAAAGVSGDVKLIAGSNVTISRSGQDITINSSYVDTTYTASTGLTLSGTAFSVNYGTAAGTACQGNDARLSDARTPLAHNHYIGTTAVQSSSANQAVSGVTSLTLAGTTPTITTTDGNTNLLITTVTQGPLKVGDITVQPGDSGGNARGNLYLSGGVGASGTSAGGNAYLLGGDYTGSANNGSGGSVIVVGGTGRATTGSATGGAVYIDGGLAYVGAVGTPTLTNGTVYIGTRNTGASGDYAATKEVIIGGSGIPVNLPGVGTSGFVKLGANGALSADTNSYSVTGHTHAASDITSGTFAFARLPSLYIGTTAIQSSSASQALTGITTINATGNITTSGTLSVYSDNTSKLLIIQGAQGTGNTIFQNSGSNGFAFTNANGALLTISSSGDTTATGNVTAYSDARLKTNVKTLENSLEKTLKLRGVSYQKDGKDGVGVIAQEIREVLPEVVIEGDDKEKTLSVAYGNIVGVLIEAIKELNAKVEDLQKQLSNK